MNKCDLNEVTEQLMAEFYRLAENPADWDGNSDRCLSIYHHGDFRMSSSDGGWYYLWFQSDFICSTRPRSTGIFFTKTVQENPTFYAACKKIEDYWQEEIERKEAEERCQRLLNGLTKLKESQA